MKITITDGQEGATIKPGEGELRLAILEDEQAFGPRTWLVLRVSAEELTIDRDTWRENGEDFTSRTVLTLNLQQLARRRP